MIGMKYSNDVTHVKFAFMLAPLAILDKASPLLADHTVFMQIWIGAFRIQTRCLRHERFEW